MVGDHAGADFLNTIDARGTAQAREHLEDYSDLLRWMKRAGLMRDAELRPLRAAAAAVPAKAHEALSEAIAFRETAHRVVTGRAHGREVREEDCESLRSLIEAARKACPLEWTARGLTAVWRNPTDLRRPLFTVALAMADLFEPANFMRVHACAGEDCDWVFLDRSPTQRRRWCHMSACGNRAKARRLRVRRAA
jgi:predicted RNA-binding Zn ribbon-like protein